MIDVWIYTLVSVIVVSLISLIGVFSLGININKLKKILIYLISFSAGALLGDAFIHLFPEMVKTSGLTLASSLAILFGILLFFSLEKFVCWRHCHMPITKTHVHSFAYMNLVGDSLHNFIDGLIIAASYLASIPIGMATTLAVILHEIPQEMGDFGVLIHGGFSRSKAIWANLLTGLVAVLGAIIALIFRDIQNIQQFLIPLAIGGFIYIAGSDLIPELHKENETKTSIAQIFYFILGVLVMLALLLVG